MRVYAYYLRMLVLRFWFDYIDFWNTPYYESPCLNDKR